MKFLQIDYFYKRLRVPIDRSAPGSDFSPEIG